MRVHDLSEAGEINQQSMLLEEFKTTYYQIIK